MIPFTTTQLTGVINKRRPVRTPILNAHFKTSPQVGTTTIQFDVLKDVEGLAIAISHGVKSTRAKNVGWDTLTVPIPRFSEHDVITANDTLGLRAPGQNSRSEPLMALYNRKMDAIRRRFDRTIEYMAIRAMQGEVVDGAGNTIATYDIAPAQNVDFGDGGDDPVDLFDDVAVAVSRALGGDPGGLIAYCGVLAYKKLRNSGKVQTLLNTPYGPTFLENGELRKVGGMTIKRLPNVFADLNGNDQPFLPDDAILIASDEMGGELVYGPCEGPGGRLLLVNYFADAWEEKDPPGTVIRIETNPIPVVTRPDSIRILKVA